MEGHMGKDKIQLLNQALNAAASSLNLAKQLLSEIEFHPAGPAETPGLVGKYDGMFMVTEAGKKYPVPDNYSAKTKLVYDDKLKMIEGPEGRRFKLLEEVEREEQEAQLAVKDGHFEALGKDGSYRLIQGAVRYWGGQEGDKLKILLPKGNRNVPFAGLTEIIGRKPGEGAVEATASSGVPPKAVTPKPAPGAARFERPAPGEARLGRPEPKPVEKPIEKVEKKEEPAKPPKTESKPAEKAPAKKEAPKPTPKLSEAKPASKLSEAKSQPKADAPLEHASGGKPAKDLDEEDLR
ncbi:MAG: hypothetical protein WDZ67_02085 [Patescibacteria group bacterium]